MRYSNSKTPIKKSRIEQEKPDQIYQNCLKILTKQTYQQNSKWLIDNKLTSFAIKNQKCLNIIHLTIHFYQTMIIDGNTSQQYLSKIINYYKSDNRKIYEYVRCLRHFEKKDYEFEYISAVAKGQNTQPISFYLKCRMAIIDSFLNKTKKQMMVSVTGDQQQWYKIVKKIYKNISEEQIIQLFTDTIKYHYLNIKKNQNQQLNGAEIWRICQIIYRQLRGSANKSVDKYYQLDQNLEYTIKLPNNRDSDSEYQNTPSKQKEVKKLFQKNIVDGLQAEDRQLIRILSYKDNNIARMLQKKHEKMIEMIAEDVQNMRKSIEEEKRKYIQLYNEKQQILKATQSINFLALSYIGLDSVQNQERLIKAIQVFNYKYKVSNEGSMHLKKLRQNKKNKRLIGIIQNQQREKC